VKSKEAEVYGSTEAQSRGNRQDNSAALEQAAEEGVPAAAVAIVMRKLLADKL
jgi:hypothetical protein